MGYSFTTFRNQHIRSKDNKVETWLFLIVEQMDSLLEPELWMKEAKEHWQEQATLSPNGLITPNLDTFLTNENRLAFFKDTCRTIYRKMHAHGEKIPKEVLNTLCRYRSPYEVQVDRDTEFYLDYGRALLRLLDGKQNEECNYV